MESKKKIAVLGGGISSLTSVWKLLEEEKLQAIEEKKKVGKNWKTKHDITVYQMGWRLGGKGASGRNEDKNNRIEEHGLHLWFGFYDNAFKMIKDVYKEYSEIKNWPGPHEKAWRKAFKGYNQIVLTDYETKKRRWDKWKFKLPQNHWEPGEDTPDSFLFFVQEFFDYIRISSVRKLLGMKWWILLAFILFPLPIYLIALVVLLVMAKRKGFYNFMGFDEETLKNKRKNEAKKKKKKYDKSHDKILQKHINPFKGVFIVLRWAIGFLLLFGNRSQILITLDFMLSVGIGLIKDKVFENGYESINDRDFKEWLGECGARRVTCNCGLIRGIYGLIFGGFRHAAKSNDSHDQQYTFEAGTALRGMLRMAMTYKGNAYYRMMGGMGDVIFAPIYIVLKKRGVKFKFFHKVVNVVPKGNHIKSIKIEKQVNLVDPGKEYNPLIKVKTKVKGVGKMDCWPNQPLYKKIKEGKALKQRSIDLESYYSDWQNVGTVNLKYEDSSIKTVLPVTNDFDLVIFGLSIGAIPFVARSIYKGRRTWTDMVDNIKPISTVAIQTWMTKKTEDLGWTPDDRKKMDNEDKNIEKLIKGNKHQIGNKLINKGELKEIKYVIEQSVIEYLEKIVSLNKKTKANKKLKKLVNETVSYILQDPRHHQHPKTKSELELNDIGSSVKEAIANYIKRDATLLGSYQRPFDTWADMSDLIDYESWDHRTKGRPKSIAYFCGPTPSEYAPNRPTTIPYDANQFYGLQSFYDNNFPSVEFSKVRGNARRFFDHDIKRLWPESWNETEDVFNWDLLTAPKEKQGIHRYYDQYFRININPTDLYVMSSTNTSRYRLKADESGFKNMFITGDWIDNGFNAGCIEASVMSGLQTARAVSMDMGGRWFEVLWENDR